MTHASASRRMRRLHEKLAAKPRKPPASRKCGPCHECCISMGIDALDKPMGQPCNHMCDNGCAIYPSRPAECREYYCAWRWGHGGSAERPDQIGMLLFFPRPGSCDGWDKAIICHELRPGASAEVDNRERLRQWGAKGLRVMVRRAMRVEPAAVEVTP